MRISKRKRTRILSVATAAAIVSIALVAPMALEQSPADATAGSSAGTNECTTRQESRTTDGGYQEYRVLASCQSLTPNAQARGILPFGGETDKRTPWFTDLNQEHASDWSSGTWGPPGTPRIEILEGVDRAPAGTVCNQAWEYDVTMPDGSVVDRAGVMCSSISPGVQLRVTLVRSGWGDTHSAWTAEAGTWHWAGAGMSWDYARIDFQADPSGAGTQCGTPEIYVTQNRPLQYDQHAVRVSCTGIAAAVQVRAGADYTGQSDTHTQWITEPGTYSGPGQTRTVPAMPAAFLEYGLRPY